MDIKSISGTTYYVKDIAVTARFYEDLGFRIGEKKSDQLTVYVNWYFIRFLSGEEITGDKGEGILLNMKVDNAMDSYTTAVKKGFKPLKEPEVTTWGTCEFVICDPDGYKLVFFEKI